MKKYLHFLRTEYKRAAVLLPATLIKAVIVALTAGMIAFCTQKMLSAGQKQGLVQVGLTAPEDRLTSLAVSYIENLESVKSWCQLVTVEQAEGERMVESGELVALLVLPEHVVEGILTGSNEPARLYVSEEGAVLGQMFEELANAGVGMLRTAQAEIYATHDLMSDMHAGQEETAAAQAETDILQESLTAMYEEIDSFNLGLVLNRERYFQEKTLSATGGQSIAVYYGSALFTVYLLLAGLFFGRYSKRNVIEQKMAAKRLSIPVGIQMAGRTLVSMGLLCVVMLPLAFLWFSEEMRRVLPVVITGKGLLLLALALCCVAALLQFLYQLADDQRTAVLLVGITTVILGYASGCFLPAALLPQVVARIAAVLPTTYIKSAFTVLFSGKVSGFAGTAAALCVWILALWGAGRLAVWLAEWREGRITKDEGKETISQNGENFGRMKVLSLMASAGYADRKNMKNQWYLFAILGKRTLCKKSLWVCLLLTMLLSTVAVRMEKQSETAVYAAVYTTDETLQMLFKEYDGLVHFLVCNSEEEVKRSVLQNKTECGYILQEDLQKEICSGNGEWSIKVYEDADSTLIKVVNEVLFERIFYAISSDWFAGYIAEKDDLAKKKEDIGEDNLRQEAMAALQEKMKDGSTFSFERQLVQAVADGETAGEGQVFYPVRLICLTGIFLCGIIGIWEAFADRRTGRFFGKSASLTAAFTIFWPVFLGIVAAGIILLLTGML